MEEVQVFIGKNLKQYVPILFKLMEGQNVSWSSINDSYLEVRKKRKRELEENSGKQFEVNFYDLIGNVLLHDDSGSEKFFIYINVVLKRLDEILDSNQKVMVGRIVRSFLKNFTLDYIHFIGELFFLDKMVWSREYKLLGVEDRMENGNEIDFKLYSYKNEKEVLVEVMNVHLWKMDLSSYSSFQNQLTNKVGEKIYKKTRGVISDHTFHVQPILWGDGDELRKVTNFYKNGLLIPINGVMEPLSYVCLTRGENEPVYRFSEISKLFDNI